MASSTQREKLDRARRSCAEHVSTRFAKKLRRAVFRYAVPQATVAKQAAHRGEHEGNRQTIARGKPRLFG